MRSVLFVAASLALGVQGAQAAELDGQWRGAGLTQEGTCPPFEFIIDVADNKVEGKAVLPDQTFGIEGELGENGTLIGQVEYFSIAFAKIEGDIGLSGGRGEWRTFKGPQCAGTFEVTKL